MAFMGEPTQARPLFRKLALGIAVVCVLLVAVAGFAPGVEDRLMGGRRVRVHGLRDADDRHDRLLAAAAEGLNGRDRAGTRGAGSRR